MTAAERKSVSYDALVAKPDMKVAIISDDGFGTLTRKDSVKLAIDSVKRVGSIDSFGRNIVTNADTGRQIVVGRNSIEHGMPRKFGSMSVVASHIGEYIKNGVKVNLISPRKNAIGGYILLEYGQTKNGKPYPAYFVVETLQTGQDEIVFFDSLYSINAKEIEAPIKSGRSFQAPTSISTISIQNLLEFVNTQFSDILSEDVLDYFGTDRRETALGKSARFQLKDETQKLRKQLSAEKALSEKLRAEFKRSKYVTPDPKQTGKAVTQMLDSYLGKRNPALHQSIMEDINKIYAEMRKKEGNWNLVDDLCNNVADKIVDRMEILHDEMWNHYAELRKTLRKTTLKLGSSAWDNIVDFEDLRKTYFGTVRVSKTKGMPMDTFYQELAESYPELFDAQEYTNEVDQLYNIIGTIDSLKPYVEEYSQGEIAEFADTIAKDVLQMSYDLTHKKMVLNKLNQESLRIPRRNSRNKFKSSLTALAVRLMIQWVRLV